jgi:spermidine/putrescine transport system ATP-binding protein
MPSGFIAVMNVGLKVEEGEFFTLLGPSGCGMTTLLRMIAGFSLPDSGKILQMEKALSIPPQKNALSILCFKAMHCFRI